MKNLFDKDLATIVAKDGQHTLIAPNGKEIPSCSTVVTDIAGDIPMVKVEMPVKQLVEYGWIKLKEETK